MDWKRNDMVEALRRPIFNTHVQDQHIWIFNSGEKEAEDF